MKRRVGWLLAMVALAASASADEWPGWRGPRHDGTSTEASFPLRWSATENVLWKIAVPGKGHSSPVEFHSVHGFCSSPILYKDLVIFNGDQDAEAYLVALDKATGQERWRADRPNRERSYVPPVIFEAAGRPQLVLSGSRCVASYD